MFSVKYEDYKDVYTKETIKKYSISQISSQILSNFCRNDDQLKIDFEKQLIKGLKKVDNIDKEVYINFINFLTKIMNRNEIENLLIKSISNYKNVSKKTDFLFKVGEFLLSFTVNYSSKTNRVWLTKK